MSAQQDIYNAVAARGYRNGLESDQMLARQVLKLLEEVCELSDTVEFPCGIRDFFVSTLEAARMMFDNKGLWLRDFQINLEMTKKELADIAVVMFVAAEIVSHIDGRPFDLIGEAKRKALLDIARGVRDAKPVR